MFCRRDCCSKSVFAHNGVARVAEYVTDEGISDGLSSSRLDAYGHTLQAIDPELSTFSVDRHEGQKGQVIVFQLCVAAAKMFQYDGWSRNCWCWW